jgi:hypothetical protein
MQNRVRLTMGAALVAAAVACAGAANADPAGVKVGTLTCGVSSGWGFVFGSSKRLHCTFRPNSHNPEHYAGSISKFGADIGYTEGGVLVWEVFAPTSDVQAGALAGHYAGVTASATVGAGGGANLLVGGSNKSIDLQPLSFQGNEGLNVAAGVAEISLRAVPPNATSQAHPMNQTNASNTR